MVTLTAKEKNCILHSVRDIILLFAKKLTSNWGVIVDDIQASTKARFPRNKYMGMWRWGSLQMRAIKPRFPKMVIRYVIKNSRNRGICHSGWYMSPVRINSVSNVAFSFSCPHWVLPEMKWRKWFFLSHKEFKTWRYVEESWNKACISECSLKFVIIFEMNEVSLVGIKINTIQKLWSSEHIQKNEKF